MIENRDRIICYVCRRACSEPAKDRCMCWRCEPFCCEECRGSMYMLDYPHKVPRRREAVLATRENLR